MDAATFVAQLGHRRHSRRVANPYRSETLRNNLLAYLEAIMLQPGRRILLVGEALGYRGGRLTGIPFSSSRLLRQAPHPFLRRLSPELVIEEDVAEATASIVWSCLAQRRNIPMAWNAFPFHPHQENVPETNRAPDAAELEEGAAILRELAALYQPQLVVGVGAKGFRAASSAFPQEAVMAVRHPSYGGKQDFVAGLKRAYRRR